MSNISWRPNSIQMIICLLNEILKVHYMTIVVRSVFQEDNKYYPQVSLDECFYES